MSAAGKGRLSSRDRGRRKEMLRIIKEDKLGNSSSMRFVVALVLLAKPDVDRATAISGVSSNEAEVFAGRLRDCRIIHRDRLDVSSFFSGFSGPKEGSGASVNMALMALFCAGVITRHKPCKHCGGPVSRAGYTSTSVQKWRCPSCDKKFVYERNQIERMQAPWESLKRAVELAKKGTAPELVASRTGLSRAQACKISRLVDDGVELRSDRRIVYGQGSSRRAEGWSPDAFDVHRIKPRREAD